MEVTEGSDAVASRTVLGIARGLHRRMDQHQQDVQANFQELQVGLQESQEGQRELWRMVVQMNQSLGAMAADLRTLAEASRPALRPVAEEAAELERQLAGAQHAAADLATERAQAEARATTAEARALAAETAAADALAEVQRVREEQAQRQAECETLRATLSGIREEGRCPIMHGICREPVVASDGQTYDRQAIEPWLRQHGSSPITRDPLLPVLYPNRLAAMVNQRLDEIGMGSSDVAEGEDVARSESSHNPQDAPGPQPAPPPRPGPLMEAIRWQSAVQALLLLQQPQPPGLNERTVDGETVLHRAIDERLEDVALAIVARPDFGQIAVQDRWRRTALHAAAYRGSLPLCRAIVGRGDFTMGRAVNIIGEIARDVARRRGHREVVVFFDHPEGGPQMPQIAWR